MARTIAKEPDSAEGVVFVGCDDGHDSIKIVARRISDSKEIKLTVPSKIVRGSRAVSLTGEGGGGVYAADKDTYTVTDALVGGDTIDTRSIGFAKHAINRILVHDALVQAGLGGQTVHLVTGLPVSDYYNGNQPNTEWIEAKKLNICDPDIRAIASGVRLAEIADHKVACEAIAAFYDMAIEDDGSDNTDFFKLLETAPVGVIDIGGKTIDLAVVYRDRNSPQVDMHRTNSINYGMLRVADLIKREIMRVHQLDDIAPRSMYKVLAEKRLMIAGEERDVSKEVAQALSQVVPDLFDRVRSRWGTAQDLAKVIVVGGGAYLLAKEVRSGLYAHSESRKEPEYANARGMLKLGMRNYLQTSKV